MEGISIGKEDWEEEWDWVFIGMLKYEDSDLSCCLLKDFSWQRDICLLDIEVPLSAKCLIKW